MVIFNKIFLNCNGLSDDGLIDYGLLFTKNEYGSLV